VRNLELRPFKAGVSTVAILEGERNPLEQIDLA
jgi:hypothetical protein